MAAITAAAIGAAATIATTTNSFVQAGKQKEAQRQAERDADEAMAKARKKLETNFYAAQSIKKEPYELEREALLNQGAQAIEAGVESERGAAATAGRVQMAQQQGQAGIRTAMGQELTALENKQLAEESRLRDIGVQLDLGDVSGAQLAARNAEEQSAQSMQQGYQGVTNFGQQVASALPLYFPTKPGKPGAETPQIVSVKNSDTLKVPDQMGQTFKGNMQSPIEKLRNPQPYQGPPTAPMPLYFQRPQPFSLNPNAYMNPFAY